MRSKLRLILVFSLALNLYSQDRIRLSKELESYALNTNVVHISGDTMTGPLNVSGFSQIPIPGSQIPVQIPITTKVDSGSISFNGDIPTLGTVSANFEPFGLRTKSINGSITNEQFVMYPLLDNVDGLEQIAVKSDIDFNDVTVTNLTVLNRFSHGESSTAVDEGSFASGLDTYAGSIGWMVKVFDHHNRCLYLTKTPITNSTEQMYFVKADGSNLIEEVDDPSLEDVPNGKIYPETDIQVPESMLPAWLSVNQDSHSDYEAVATNYAGGVLYYTGDLTQLANRGEIVAHADSKNIDMGAVKLLAELNKEGVNITKSTANVSELLNSNGSVFTGQTGGTVVNVDTNYVGTHVLNWYSTVFGRRNYSAGNFTLVSGDMNSALGDYAQVSGKRNQAGYMAHAEGNNNRALGFYSHAEGNGTIARGMESHSEGLYTIATGNASHADGQYASATNHYSYVWSGEGASSVESRYGSHGQGTFNINPVGGTKGFYIGDTPLSDIANVDTNVVKEVIYNSAYVRGQQGVTTNGFKYLKLDFYDEATDFDGGLHIYINTNENDIAESGTIGFTNGAEVYKATSVDRLIRNAQIQVLFRLSYMAATSTDFSEFSRRLSNFYSDVLSEDYDANKFNSDYFPVDNTDKLSNFYNNLNWNITSDTNQQSSVQISQLNAISPSNEIHENEEIPIEENTESETNTEDEISEPTNIDEESNEQDVNNQDIDDQITNELDVNNQDINEQDVNSQDELTENSIVNKIDQVDEIPESEENTGLVFDVEDEIGEPTNVDEGTSDTESVDEVQESNGDAQSDESNSSPEVTQDSSN